MKVHKSCKTLSIYSFDRIIETQDLRYLIKDFNEFYSDDIIINELEAEELSSNFNNIVNEYNCLTVNTKMLSNYRKEMTILELEFLHDTTYKILELFVKTNTIEVLCLLVDLHWDFDEKKPIEPQILVIQQKLKTLRNKIRINKTNFVNLNKGLNNNNKSNLSKEALYLEISLGINRAIDTKKTTVEEWVNMINLSAEKNKNHVSNKHNDS